MQDHKDATKEDFLKHARGEMDASELEWRHSARLAEIADYEAHGEAYERAEATEAHKEALKARRTRWHGFTYAAMRFFPYYAGLDLTKAQKAVLCALMAAGRGKKTFAVARLDMRQSRREPGQREDNATPLRGRRTAGYS